MDWIGIESGVKKEEIGEDVGGRNASNNYSPRITKTHFHFIKLKRKKGGGGQSREPVLEKKNVLNFPTYKLNHPCTARKHQPH